MNITHLNFPVITPIKALWHWLMAEPGHTRVREMHRRDYTQSFSASASTLRSQVLKASPCSNSYPTLRRPVRVLRVMEAGQAPTHVGRMRISGCMADVCAELDRLAARESMLH